MIWPIALTFLLSSWLLPTHFPPWVSWHNEVLGFVSAICCVAAVLANCQKQKNGAIPVPHLALVLAAIMGLLLVQLLTGLIPFSGDALVLVFYLVLCFCMIAVGFNGARTTVFNLGSRASWKTVDGLAVVLLTGALLSTVIATAQVFDVWEQSALIARMPLLRRPGANMGQPNQLASLLVMGMASVSYLYESRKASAVFATFLLAILIAGVTVTESRTGILSCVLLAAWLLAWRNKVGLRTSPWAVVSGVVALFILLLGWPHFFAYVQSGGMPEGDVVLLNTSAGSRLIVWPQLVAAVLQKPWFGWGLLGVSKAHNAVLHLYTTAEPFTYAHNIVLDMAVGMGLPLTLMFVVVAAVWLCRRVRATKSLTPWYCLAVMLPFGVHSMLEFPFAYTYFLVPVMLAAGVLEASHAPQRLVRVGWWPATVGLVIVAALMAWSVVEYIAIEEDFRVVRFEALHVGQTPSNYERPKINLLNQLDALLDAGRIVPAPGMQPECIELSRKVAMRYPWTATQNRYALSLALNGNPEEALRQLKVMRIMHGEKAYEGIKANWVELSNTKYPQLKDLALP
jgi:O-antigen ligase